MPKHQYVKPKEQLIKEEQQRKARLKKDENTNKSKVQKSKFILYGISALIVLAVIAFAASEFISQSKPGEWDNFAKCLSGKDVIVYGNMQTCKYSQHQASMFGKSFSYLNYKDAIENKEVKVTPTWYINGEKLEGEQSFETLSEKTGCSIY